MRAWAGIGVDLGRNDGIVADADVATVNDLLTWLEASVAAGSLPD